MADIHYGYDRAFGFMQATSMLACGVAPDMHDGPRNLAGTEL